MMGEDKMDLPQRTPNRLREYDYSQNGAYFLTICTKDKRKLFWDVGARIARPDKAAYQLSEYGAIINGAVQKISIIYPVVSVDKYVIMPNHVHLLLSINNNSERDVGGRAKRAPTISTIINQMKGYVTKQIGHSIWQRSYHDHIIRDCEDYLTIWNYINANPQKWEEDCFYTA